MSATSPTSLWRRMLMEMGEHPPGQRFEAAKCEPHGVFHLLWRRLSHAAQRCVRIIHHLRGKPHWIARLGGHVRREHRNESLDRHDPAAKLVVRTLDRGFFSFEPLFVVPKSSREILKVPDSRLADMRRKAFRTLRLLKGQEIRAAVDRFAQGEAERYLGFGHPPQDVEQYKLKGEDLAAHIDFEILKSFACFRHLTFSELKGVPPEDWFVMHHREQAA